MSLEQLLKMSSGDLKKSISSAVRGANKDQRSVMENFRKKVNAEKNKNFNSPSSNS